jgi:perosamine synthetase
MIFTSLSPNTERDDILLAFKLIFNPGRWKDKEIVPKVEKTLSETLNISHVTAVDSGRTALYTILKALNISEGDEVIVQAYTCVAVPDPVIWVGATPVYADCTNDLVMDINDLEKKITPATRAIVVQHTLGIPAPIEKIMEIAKRHSEKQGKKIWVIEDCAHALNITYNGKKLGAFGDISFFSFGRDKCISSVFGGAIGTASTELGYKVKQLAQSYPMPKGSWIFQQLSHPLVMAEAKTLYNVANLGKVIIEIAKTTGIISKAVEPKELTGGRPKFTLHQFSPALAFLLDNQLKKLDRYTKHRKMTAKKYMQRLSSTFKSPQIDIPYLRYPVFVENRKEIFEKAKQHKIELGNWYDTVIAPKNVVYDKVGYKQGMCPNAERLAEKTINLPTHITISSENVEYIINHVFS